MYVFVNILNLVISSDVLVRILNGAINTYNGVCNIGLEEQERANGLKQGHIINIGSTVDRSTKGAEWIYPQEKQALKSLSHQLAMLGIWGQSGIRVSYISFGSLETKKVSEKHPDRTLMNVTQAAEYIKWVIDAPINININELHMDPIQ